MTHQLLLLDDGSPHFDNVVDTIMSNNLDIDLHILPHEDALDTDYMRYHCVIALCQHGDDVSLSRVKTQYSKLSSASMLVLAPATSIETARFCYLNEHCYFLAVETVMLLPAMIQKIRTDIAQHTQQQDAIQRRQMAIVALASHPAIQQGHFEQALQNITKTASDLLDVSRVGIWLYNDDRSLIRCHMLYDATTDEYDSGLELTARQFPTYFAALEENRVIAAVDANKHPATTEFSASYLTPLQIQSLLDVPIRVGGKMVGIICNEQTKTYREWDHLEQHFAASLADLVGDVLQNQAQRSIEETLRKRENYLRDAEAIAHLGNFELDLRDNTLLWSDEIYRIFELPQQTPVSLDMYQSLLAPEAYEKIASAAANLIETGESYTIEHDIILIDGKRKTVLSIGSPVYGDDGAVIKIFGILQDITHLKQGEQNRLDLELQQQKMIFLEEFVAAMTHDLKTPVTGIRSSTYLMRRKAQDDTFMPYLDRIDRHLDRLSKMIEDLLTISRLENMPPTTFANINLNSFFVEVVQTLRAKADEKSIDMVLETSSEPIYLQALPDEMMRALVNLVDNAINYTPQSGTVTITCQREADNIIFSIQDTGIGIPSEDLPHIFEQFYRSDNARSFTSGTGLGLAIVKKIIDLHGGTINVVSQASVGTTFTIIFDAISPIERVIRKYADA